MTDEQIAVVAKKAAAKHPGYVSLRKIQIGIWIALVAAAVSISLALGTGLGLGLLAAGVVNVVFVVIWNLVRLNTVLFRITEEEMQGVTASARW